VRSKRSLVFMAIEPIASTLEGDCKLHGFLFVEKCKIRRTSIKISLPVDYQVMFRFHLCSSPELRGHLGVF
jgi:hypothetical protein